MVDLREELDAGFCVQTQRLLHLCNQHAHTKMSLLSDKCYLVKSLCDVVGLISDKSPYPVCIR